MCELTRSYTKRNTHRHAPSYPRWSSLVWKPIKDSQVGVGVEHTSEPYKSHSMCEQTNGIHCALSPLLCNLEWVIGFHQNAWDLSKNEFPTVFKLCFTSPDWPKFARCMDVSPRKGKDTLREVITDGIGNDSTQRTRAYVGLRNNDLAFGWIRLEPI